MPSNLKNFEILKLFKFNEFLIFFENMKIWKIEKFWKILKFFWNFDLKLKKILELSNNYRIFSKVSKSTKKVYGTPKLRLI